MLTLYKCPECHQDNEGADWNQATRIAFGENIITIESAFRIDDRGAEFTCPICFNDSERAWVYQVHTDFHNNEDALMLLKEW